MKSISTLSGKLLGCVAVALVGISSSAQAQVLGGGAGAMGGLNGGLSGAQQNIGGSLRGGMTGSGEIGSSAFGSAHPLSERALNRTRSTIDDSRGNAEAKASATKHSALRAKDAASTRAENKVEGIGKSAASVDGAATGSASTAAATGTNSTLDGSVWASDAINRNVASTSNSVNVVEPPTTSIDNEKAAHISGRTSNSAQTIANAKPVKQSDPSSNLQANDSVTTSERNAVPQGHSRSFPAPSVSTQGRADGDADAGVQNRKPHATASANADGNARVSRK